jgi:hypothetical protein
MIVRIGRTVEPSAAPAADLLKLLFGTPSEQTVVEKRRRATRGTCVPTLRRALQQTGVTTAS